MRELSAPERRLRFAAVGVLVLVIIGTTGYVALEGYPPIDALYMAVITLATVGFQEVHPLSATGRIFTIGLVVSGVITFGYAVSQVTELLADGSLLQRRRREQTIARMERHVIICGFGRIGQRVARKFHASGIPFVVIDRDAGALTHIQELTYLFVEGDAREDDVLQRAGIDGARSLVAALSSDADNVYVILSARTLNPRLHIVARAGQPASIAKLEQAGANRVIAPYEIGSQYVANAVLRPTVVDFMDIVAQTESDKSADLEIDEVVIPHGSPYIGILLKDTPIRSQRNIIVLAIKDAEGTLRYNPPSETVLREDDTLICIGFSDQIEFLARDIQHKPL